MDMTPSTDRNTNSNARTLQAALIGAGGIAAGIHIPAHKRLKGSSLKWVCDMNGAAARAIAEKYDIPCWTDNLDDILQDAELDWVDIATPNNTHEAIAIRALEKGKHVFVQKPMAATAEAAARMEAAAAAANRQLGVFMCFRGDRGLRFVKKLIDEGRLGQLITLRGKMISANGFRMADDSWRMEEGCGALELLGIHLIDAFQWLHSKVRTVSSYSDRLYANMNGDDVTTAIYGLDAGVTAIMETTYCSYVGNGTPMYVLEVNGTKGSVRYRMDGGRMELELEQAYRDEMLTYDPEQGVEVYQFHHWSHPEAVANVHQDFADALRSGIPFSIGAAEGARAMQVMEATHVSAKQGKRIDL